MTRRAILFLAAIALRAQQPTAELRVATSGAFTAAFRALAPGFEGKTGTKVTGVFGSSMGDTPESIPNRLKRGEPIDLVILAASSLDDLIKQGTVLKDGRTDLVRSSIALAVRTGSPRPDISSVDALKKTLLAAKSVAYSDSASGQYLSTELFPKLGIADQIKPKSRKVAGEPVGEVVARGEVELGFQQVSELRPVKGIDIVGPLPDGAQRVTIFAAGVVANSKNRKAATDFLRFVQTGNARKLVQATGLEPVR